MEFLQNLDLILWFSKNFWTNLLFLVVYIILSIILSYTFKHEEEDGLFEDAEDFFDFFFNFPYFNKHSGANSIVKFIAKTNRFFFYIGLYWFIICLFLNSTVTYWSYTIISAFIILITILRLIINKELVRKSYGAFKKLFTGIRNHVKPSWKHMNSEKREEAIKRITNQKTLKKVVRKSEDVNIRHSAIKKISDQDFLKKIALNSDDWHVPRYATKKIVDVRVIENIALNAKSGFARDEAVKKVVNPDVLEIVALNDDWNKVGISAIKSIKKVEILKKVTLNAKTIDVRREAIKRITNKDFLKKIIAESTDYESRRIAYLNQGKEFSSEAIIDYCKNIEEYDSRLISKLVDQEDLYEIAINSKNEKFKIDAVKRISDQNFLEKIALNRDSEHYVSLEAIGKITNPNILIEYSKDTSYWDSFKERALIAMGNLKKPNKEIINRLIENLMMKDNLNYRQLALDGLTLIAERTPELLLEHWKKIHFYSAAHYDINEHSDSPSYRALGGVDGENSWRHTDEIPKSKFPANPPKL